MYWLGKVPEIFQMNMSDMYLLNANNSIHNHKAGETKILIPLSDLRPIHPIDRSTAISQCEERAQAAREALPWIRENNMTITEELIANEPSLECFKSVTGLQVVALRNGTFVTFEGNGRREALQRAFPRSSEIMVEVRLFYFDKDANDKVVSRVQRVRKAKGMI